MSQGWKDLQFYYKETPAQVFSCEIGEIFKKTFFYRTSLVAASEIENSFYFLALFVMISFLFETCDFTNNANFISFRWRLKRNHSPAKCVIHATEICRMEICLKSLKPGMFSLKILYQQLLRRNTNILKFSHSLALFSLY